MLGYRGVGGEIDGVRNPTLWARPGETVRITIINGETMVHDVVLEKLGTQESADSRQGGHHQHHVQSVRKRHLLLLRARPQTGRHGRPPRGVGRTAPDTGGHRARGERTRAQPGFRERHTERLDSAGDAFELVKAESQTGTRNGHAGTYWISSAVGGSARKGSLSSVKFTVTHPYASFLVSGGAFDSTRVEAGVGGHQLACLQHLRCRPAHAAAGGGGSERTSRQGHLRSSRRRRSGGADGDLYQREPVGPHQLRSFSFPRVETLLRERNHARGHHHHAAGGSGHARRPVAQGGSPRHDACPRGFR